MKVLSNYDIQTICKQHNIRINGIVYKNELPGTLQKGWFIYLIRNGYDNSGHWCCFRIGKPCLYFDSFGTRATEELERRLGNDYVYNHNKIQHLNSSSCGWYCMMIIQQCEKHGNTGDAFKEALSRFVPDKPEINERVLQNYWLS